METSISIIAPDLVAILSILFVVLCLVAFIIASFEQSYKSLGIITFIFTVWLLSEGWGVKVINSYEKVDEKILVSASPSQTQINGRISGFMFISGVINESRYYLLREQVEDGLYKDFEVKKEVYIRENPELVNTGKFIQIHQCHELKHSYELIGINIVKPWFETQCNFKRQEIIVPTGYVIKDLNI